jgi:hypothetical protein
MDAKKLDRRKNRYSERGAQVEEIAIICHLKLCSPG